VLTFGIPKNETVGYEMTANFYAYNISNDGVFYTDSNGLEMQTRKLNFRPSWDLKVKDGGLNITANYYPVQTAVAIVDEVTNMRMVVMNDRSQGGSVIKDGRIELMYNRRINKDDERGVEEALNEVDANGNGISVPATYYVQLFNQRKKHSLQRII
jgi:hypothetical protein